MQEKPLNIIAILSPPYSGSTLLAHLISNHPAITSIGERDKFHRKKINPRGEGSFECSCGKSFHECEFWSAIYNDLAQHIPLKHGFYYERDFTQFRFLEHSGLRRRIQNLYTYLILNHYPLNLPWIGNEFFKMRQANVELLRSIARVGQSNYVLDSSKKLHHLVYLGTAPELRIHVIKLRRDGRGQCNSAMFYTKSPMSKVAQSFVQFFEQKQNILSKLSLPSIEIYYEDLCRNPETELRKIFEFIGLDSQHINVNLSQKTQHIMGGMSTRLASTREIHLDEKWKTSLTASELAEFERIAGQTNRQLGYR